jgi:hypothetical protein
MIDIVQEFKQHEAALSRYVRDRASKYYESECFKVLDRRIRDLTYCADCIPNSLIRHTFNSKVVFPVVKERMLLRAAITASNYRAPEVFNCQALGNTPMENAAQAELVLNLNQIATNFKEKALKPGIKRASQFGTAVFYTYWRGYDKLEMATVFNPETGQYERSLQGGMKKNACTIELDLRSYYQNPEVADPDESDFQGHYRRVHIADLMAMENEDGLIGPNLLKAVEEAKKSAGKSARRPYNEPDERRWGVDIQHYEGILHIKGNEDDDTIYFVDMVGDIVIRISYDDYDYGIRSYSVANYNKRLEWWWGNGDAEYVVSHENFLNVLLSMTADNAMRSMLQYVFFEKSTIDPADINNRVRNNGFIPVDAGQIPLSNLVFPFQPSMNNTQLIEFAVNAVNNSIQGMSTKADLSRRADQGGPGNKTATAANIIAGQGDVLEGDILENFDFGICGTGKKSLIMLQQFLSSMFWVRPKPNQTELLLNKYQILGVMSVAINSTLQKNKQGELMRLENLVTWLLNVTQSPQLASAGLNLLPIVRDIIHKSDLPTDAILSPENVQTGAPGFVKSRPITGPAGNGAAAPAQLPAPQQSGRMA